MAADGPDPLLTLPTGELRDRLARGAVDAADLARACLDQIARREPEIGAWAWLDGDHAMAQAETADTRRKAGRAIGPLHGLPVGLKDVIDTARIPTENGTPVDAGRVPERDGAIVTALHRAGAVIMGKTVTTELAFMHPARTRNPAGPAHTPGGSSAGSAAAVAAGMVPFAVGTQTAGSVIRPAAFCGVTGFKPTFGAIPRTGILDQAPSLDTVGVFARTPADAAMLADALFGHDAGDADTVPRPAPRLHATATTEPPVRPTLGFVRPEGWAGADTATHEAFAELAEALGGDAFEVELPTPFAHAAELHRRVHLAELAKCFFGYARRGADRLSIETVRAMEAGDAVLARDYLSALDWCAVLEAGLEEVFARCDALLAPAAPGPAPRGLESTGDPVFNGLWTFCGTPAVTVPVLTSQEGLPMGVQLIAGRGDDARLLRTANWLMRRLEG